MNKEEANELLLAMASAFVWIASSDEGVEMAEWQKYKHVMVESPFASQFNEEDIRIYFKDLVTAFSDNYEVAIDVATSHIEKMRGNPVKSEEILRISRAAVISDGGVDEVEENALQMITSLLGIKDSYP